MGGVNQTDSSLYCLVTGQETVATSWNLIYHINIIK